MGNKGFRITLGQSLIEYATLIGIVTMALTVLFPLVKRGLQGVVQTGADFIGGGNPAPPDQLTLGPPSNTSTSVAVTSTQQAVQTPGQIKNLGTQTIQTNTVTRTQL